MSVPLVINVTRAAWPSFSSFVVSVPLVMNVTRAAGLALVHFVVKSQLIWVMSHKIRATWPSFSLLCCVSSFGL